MTTGTAMSGRELKRRIGDGLRRMGPDHTLEQMGNVPLRRVVSPLLSFLYAGEANIRRAAVRALGKVVARLADEDREAARVVLRRLMWNLNDESGGIGWGSPEAMGEILYQHEGLAAEFGHILLSYTMEEGNFLEHPGLQRGLLWGIGRWGGKAPRRVGEALPHLRKYLSSPDAGVRGEAARLMGVLAARETHAELEALLEDPATLTVMNGGQPVQRTVGTLAAEALRKLTATGERGK